MKRKILDEKGRIFGIISVIDLFAVAIVIALAAAVYMRFFTNETTATVSVNDEFTYQIRLNSVRDLTVNALREGDILYDNENNTYLGKVVKIEPKPTEKLLSTLDGSYVMAPVEERYDAIITIETTGLISNGRYYSSRTFELNVNGTVSFHTKYSSTSGTVWSVGAE